MGGGGASVHVETPSPVNAVELLFLFICTSVHARCLRCDGASTEGSNGTRHGYGT